VSNTKVTSLTIAVVGWGRMGGAMGSRLIDAGYRVTAVDIDEDARTSAERSGAELADNAAAAVRVCEFVVTMLDTPGAVREVAQEEDGVLSGIQPGTLWLEMSSSQPRLTSELSAAAADRMATLVDAPVSGGVKGARDGSLTIMVGASRDALNRARPLLDVLGNRIVHVGDQPGLGDLAKTVNNMLSAANLAAAAEGLALGMSGGLEPARLLDVLNGSTGASNATQVKLPNYVLPGGYDAGFSIAQYVKDLDIALECASDYQVSLALLAEARRMWAGAVAASHGEEDHTKIVPYIWNLMGVKPGARDGP
jgi:3-hydroxyisobutyrate dehydrogenase-like beta-hydroxyacid dehydrogenase